MAAAFSRSSSRALTVALTAQIINGRLMMHKPKPTGHSCPRMRTSPKKIIIPRPETTSGIVNGSSR